MESLGESFGTLVPQVSGMRRDWNHITVDGVLGNEVGQTNRMAQNINLDAVSEIKILLNTFRAEYGRTGGAHIEIVSKSGDQQYRGNAYYYGRNEHLNANNFFNNRAGRDRPRYRFNTYGFNLGGPVPGVGKDGDRKLFFFYSLEAPITEKPGNLLQWTMPTDRERERRLLAEPRQLRPPRRHPGPAHRAAVPGQHRPGQPHRPQRTRPPERPAPAQHARPQLHARASSTTRPSSSTTTPS